VQEADMAVIEHFKRRVVEENHLNSILLQEHPRNFQHEWAWYMQAQHYRIPTRLLDWTAEPNVALFFAVEEAINDSVDGAFYVYYNPTSEVMIEGGAGPHYFDVLPEEMHGTWFMNPAFELREGTDEAIAEARRARQHGKFTLQDYHLCRSGLDLQPGLIRDYWGTSHMNKPVMEKYIIPAAFKGQLRLEMAAKGWYGEWLYKNEDPVINAIRAECVQLLAARVAAAGH
jgi:hypothetical protein